MKRILVLLIVACMGCGVSASAAKPATQKTVERRECGPSGLIQVLEIEGVTFIRLQKGCHVYRDEKVVGFEPGDDEILTANEAGRYELPFPGAYFYFQEGRPHLSYLARGERRNAILTPLKNADGFSYSAFLKTLKGV